MAHAGSLVVEACPVLFRVFSSITGFYPPDASGTHPSVTRMCPDIAKCLLGGKIAPVENYWDRDFLKPWIMIY